MTKAKRFLAILLCFVMCFSMLPTWALAEEVIADDEAMDEVITESNNDNDENIVELVEDDYANSEQEDYLVGDDALPEEEYVSSEPEDLDDVTQENTEDFEAILTEEVSLEEVYVEAEEEDGAAFSAPEEIILETPEKLPEEEPSGSDAIGPDGTLDIVNDFDDSDVDELPDTAGGEAVLTDVDTELGVEDLEEAVEIKAAPTKVVFHLTPADAVLTVYYKVNGANTVIFPESDGSYLLEAGVYYYTLEADGYLSIPETELIVYDSSEPIELSFTMIPSEAVADSAEEKNAVEREEEIQELTSMDSSEKTARADAQNNVVASGTCGENLTWELDDQGVLTISGTGAMTDWTDWTKQPWLENSGDVRSIIIEKGVTSIGSFAFSMCSNLLSVTIPEGVTKIGQDSFSMCSCLLSVTIPNSVISIGAGAFSSCMDLTNLTIPVNVTYIGRAAFDCCHKLKELIIPSRLTRIENWAFHYCCDITSLIIPDGVTSIGEYAFADCVNITSLTIPASLKDIGSDAFLNCDKVQDVYYNGDELRRERIFGSLFPNATWHYAGKEKCGERLTWQYNSSNRTLSITGDGELWDYNTTFPSPWSDYNSLIVNVDIDGGVTSIGDYAFANLEKVTRITIPAGVTRIGSNAFNGCTHLTSLLLPSSVEKIGKGAFNNCNGLISAGPTGSGSNYEFGWTDAIPDNAFSACTELESINIPFGITHIGNRAFHNCKKLTAILLPSSVSYIGSHAFYGCKKLTNITIPNGVESIKTSTFQACSSLSEVIIPSSVISIGDHAFQGCSSLTIINIPDNVQNIGEVAFNGCSSLEQVKIPARVSEISFDAFSCCSSLKKVEIPQGVEKICDQAFMGCTNLEMISFPDSVKYLEDRVFSACPSLKGVFFGHTVPSIQKKSFYGVKATAHYPCNGNWWKEDMIDYGGTLIWVVEHEWDKGEITKQADYKEKGKILYTCQNDQSHHKTVVVPKLKLGIISGVTTKVTKAGITVKWKSVPAAERYYVQRKVGNGKWVKVYDQDGTSFTDTNVKSGKQYTYRVRARRDTEGVNGAYTEGTTVTFLAQPKISSVANAKTGVTIKWSEIVGASKYRIWRKEAGGNWKRLAETTKNSYTDKKAVSGVRYSYRIKCLDENGNLVNTYSAAKSITFLAVPVISSVRATAGKVTIKWAKSGTATKYRVFRKGPGEADWKKLGDTKKATIVDKTAVAGVKYSYAIKAYNGSAKVWSAQSGAKSVTAK